MRYFKAIMNQGHAGSGKYKEVPIFVYAKTALEAMDYVKKLPSLKHNALPLSLIEVTKEEYEEGRKKDEYIKSIIEGLGKIYEESYDLH